MPSFSPKHSLSSQLRRRLDPEELFCLTLFKYSGCFCCGCFFSGRLCVGCLSFFVVFFVVHNYYHHQHHQTKSLHSTPFRIKAMVQTEPPSPSQNNPKTTSHREEKKSCIREKKNLSTDADSRTNTILERSRD